MYVTPYGVVQSGKKSHTAFHISRLISAFDLTPAAEPPCFVPKPSEQPSFAS
jgi:hypothetical protein